MGIQGNLNAQEEDTTLRPSDETEVETSSIVYIGARFLQGFKPTSDILKSNQDLDSGGVESKNTTEEDVPIALQPRSKVQLQHPTEATKNEDLLDRLQIEAELKELLKRLIIQNKKQQDKIQEMSFSLQTVLELQISIVQDVQRNIEAILQNDESQEKFDKIPSSISDHRKLIKRFKPTGTDADAIHDASSRHFEPKTTSETYVTDDVNQTTEASSRHCAFVVGSNRDRTDKDSAIKSGVYIKVSCKDTRKDIRKLLPTGPLDDSAISNAKAFMVTPKKKNPKDTSNSVENSEIDGSTSASDAGQETEASDESLNRSEDISELSNSVENSEIGGSSGASDAGQETEASDESFNRSEDISELSDIEDSFDLKTITSFFCPRQTKKVQPKSKESRQDLSASHSRKSAVDTKPSFHGHIRSSRKGSYIVPTESKKVQEEARKRFVDALNQVPDAVHYNLEGQRTTTTLYVGNLDYNADANPLLKTLRKYFRYRIKVDEVIVPENNGKSRGYAFVTLSWAKAANVNPSDICKFHSGMIDVNSRYIYLRKLRNDNLQTGYLGRRGTASIAKM